MAQSGRQQTLDSSSAHDLGALESSPRLGSGSMLNQESA